MYYNIKFSAKGFMFASIGFPCVTNKTTVEEMHAAFYSILDLATKIVASEPYLKITNRKGEYVLLPHIEPFPGAFEAPQIQLELPVKFHPEGSAYGNPHEPKTAKNMNPEITARECTSEILINASFMGYEDSLLKFDIKQWLSHF